MRHLFFICLFVVMSKQSVFCDSITIQKCDDLTIFNDAYANNNNLEQEFKNHNYHSLMLNNKRC